MADVTRIPGIASLWRITSGDPRVCVGVLDGPVNLAVPSFRGRRLRYVAGAPERPDGPALRHGTYTASLIFGDHSSAVKGLAPQCSGVLVPIFSDLDATTIRHCSQQDLAAAIVRAVRSRAQIINISAGQFSAGRAVEPQLADAIDECRKRRVLVVSAAGNDGRECVHVPGSLPSVLAVGALDDGGRPLEMSNWGEPYRTQGVLAPGHHIVGALPSGGTCRQSGTSVATAVVSGTAALLLSAALALRKRVDALAVREAVLATTERCVPKPGDTCDRWLAGTLNVTAALQYLCGKGDGTLSDDTRDRKAGGPDHGVLACVADAGGDEPGRREEGRGGVTVERPAAAPAASSLRAVVALDAVEPMCGGGGTGCGCGCGGKGGGGGGPGAPGRMGLRQVYAGAAQLQKVPALGQISYDYESDAKRDSIQAALPDVLIDDPVQLAAYLRGNERHLYRAESFIWTVEVDNAVPVCAIQPQGPFARDEYAQLVAFLDEQERGTDGVRADIVAVTGHVVGQVTLAKAGRVVPVIEPDLEGMRNMNLPSLLHAAKEAGRPAPPPETAPEDEKELYRQMVEQFDTGIQTASDLATSVLEVLFDRSKGLAVTSGERAQSYVTIDFAAYLNRFFADVFRRKVLEDVSVRPTPNTPVGRDYQDVTLSFFDPDSTDRATVNLTLTVDVTDVNPRLAVVDRPFRFSRGPVRF